jgi:hypothetical protein
MSREPKIPQPKEAHSKPKHFSTEELQSEFAGIVTTKKPSDVKSKPSAPITTKAVQRSPEETLQLNVERLRKALTTWTRADIAYNALSAVISGSKAPPVIEFVTSHDNKPVRLAIDLEKVEGSDLPVLVDLLMGPAIKEYEDSLLEIVKSSKLAYDALQKYKEV